MDVGRILDRLEQQGIRENTLVIFLSDNGFSLGHHGFWGKGNGTYPANMYENSIKVPAVMSHPERMPQGTVQRAMVSAYDFMPTLLSYLDLPVPEDRNLPGRNVVSAWLGKEDTGRDHVVVFDEYGGTRMIRTAEWKYVHRYPNGPCELYDLIHDPDERTNLTDDLEYSSKKNHLHQEMESWFDRYVEPDVDGKNRPITGSGQLRPIGASWDDGSRAFAKRDD
jgi:arylsulfatase A-like enzyme